MIGERLTDEYILRYEPCTSCGYTVFNYKLNLANNGMECRCERCGAFLGFVQKKENAVPKAKRYVRERDGYRCTRCHKQLVGVQAQVHHLQPTWFRPDLVAAQSNMITLCPECHRHIHGAGGTIREEAPDADS